MPPCSARATTRKRGILSCPATKPLSEHDASASSSTRTKIMLGEFRKALNMSVDVHRPSWRRWLFFQQSHQIPEGRIELRLLSTRAAAAESSCVGRIIALLPFIFPFYDRNVAVDRKIPEVLCSAARQRPFHFKPIDCLAFSQA